MRPALGAQLCRLGVAALACLAPAAASSSADTAVAPQTATVYAWPLSAPSPAPYLSVRYDTRARLVQDSQLLAAASSSAPYASDAAAADDDDLTRLGLYDASAPASKRWRGLLVSARALHAPGYNRTVSLLLEPDGGAPHHVALRAELLAAKPATLAAAAAGADKVHVELVAPAPGPAPHVDRPVLVTEDGSAPEPVEEKSLLQKCVPPRYCAPCRCLGHCGCPPVERD